MKYSLTDNGQIRDADGTVYTMPNAQGVYDSIKLAAQGIATAMGVSFESVFETQLGSILKSAKKIERDTIGEKRDLLASYITGELAQTNEQNDLNYVAQEFAELVRGKLTRYGVESYTPKPKDEDERFVLASKIAPKLDAIAEDLGDFDLKYDAVKGYRITVADPDAYASVEPLFEARAAVIGLINAKASELGAVKTGDVLKIGWEGTTPVIKSPASGGTGTGEPRVMESHKGKTGTAKFGDKVITGTWEQMLPQILTLVPDAKAKIAAMGKNGAMSLSPSHFYTKNVGKRLGFVEVHELT